MRIGIDARMWNEKGIGRYIRGLIKALAELALSDSFVLFCLAKDRAVIEEIVPKEWELVTVDIRWYTLQEQLQLPFYLYAAKLDVLHVPHFNIPILYRKDLVVTLHDLTHFVYKMQRASRLPGWLYELKHLGYEVILNNAIQRAKQIITVSQYVKNDLVKRYPGSASKLDVIYEAAEPCAVVASDKIIRILSELGVTKRYFYYIGNAHPHKNLEFLLQGFQKFREKHAEVQLVLSGHDEYFWPKLKKWAIYEHLAENVVFTGYVADITKDTLMRGAVGYVFPSLSEGFGLPMLEAMQCGCPVLAADTTSLPEIGGDAAVYFDPKDQESLVRQLVRVYESKELRDQLIQLGHARAGLFDWKKMAEQTLSHYQSI